MKRILLLGKNGQIGWELQRALAPLGTITALGRDELDLSRLDDIPRIVRTVRPEIIVNAAAYTAVDRAEKEQALAHAINAEAPGILAQEAAALDATLVHYSTDYVFDGRTPGAYSEPDETNPLSVYGRTKLEGEQAIRRAGGAHFILRTSWVYGSCGKNFLLTMLGLANSKPEIRVVSDQAGVPTWSHHLANATAQILRASGSQKSRLHGTYNVTAGGQTTWHGFAKHIVTLGAEMDLCPAVPVTPIGTADYPTPAKRPANSVLSTQKLTDTFALPTPDWRDHVRQCLEDIRRQNQR